MPKRCLNVNTKKATQKIPSNQGESQTIGIELRSKRIANRESATPLSTTPILPNQKVSIITHPNQQVDNTPKTLISKQQVGSTSESSSPLISPNCQVGDAFEASRTLISPNHQVGSPNHQISDTSEPLIPPSNTFESLIPPNQQVGNTSSETSSTLIPPNQQVGNTSSETSSTSDKLQLQYTNCISLSPNNEFESTDIKLNSAHKV
ncbi:5672_t:CDS:2 [Dentiscutata heterogama]|uniref:5672_t:CDS:1 n=1 Tax=Dentiscutata heterogama TaxID=1316150 RepID=A0ACA9NER2_9GLOM|nr:5672_t:CDS:2 [Dentiscutata heterogama]